MKRYDCYYENDFRQEYPALSKPAEDGDWALYEDAQAAIGEWKNLAHQREYKLSLALLEKERLREDIRLAETGLANYAQEVERLRALLRRWQFDVGGAMEDLEQETLTVINAYPA